jgi:hypothetical protein
MDRYAPQRRLLEVGERGQATLLALSVCVPARGLAADVCAEYLRRAGVGSVEIDDVNEPPPFRHAALFRFGAPAAVAEGAWRALQELRRALGVPSP